MTKNNNGFTLVEIIAAMAVGIIMLGAIYVAVNSAQRSSSGIERKVIAQQDAKSALELIAMEIRMASYNMNMTTGNWLKSDCSTVSDYQTYRGIQNATPTTITVEMDMNDNCTASNNPNCMINTGSSNPNEVITYDYDMANQRITRNVSCSGNQSFLGSDTAGDKTVRVINDQNNSGGYDAGDVPLFRYYNGAGTEIYPGTTPSIIPTIRTIEITLVVETEQIDPSTNQRRRMVYSTRVMPRNHAITQ